MKKGIFLLCLIISLIIISGCIEYPSGRFVKEKVDDPPFSAMEPEEETSIISNPEGSYSSSSDKKVITSSSTPSNSPLSTDSAFYSGEEEETPVKPKKIEAHPNYSPSLFSILFNFFEILFKLQLSPASAVISGHEPDYPIHNKDSIDITLTTYVDATCRYSYDENIDFRYMEHFFSGTGQQHFTELANLQPGRTYKIYARCNTTNSVMTKNDYNITYRILPEINDAYPRLATVKHLCITSQDDVEDLAKYDLLVMHKRHSWDTLSCNTQQLADIRDLNSNVKILVHMPQSYIQYPQEGWPEDGSYPQEGNIKYPLMDGITFHGPAKDRMILSDTQGDPILLERSWGYEATADITPLCPEGEEGSWNDQKVNYAKEVTLASGVWDGVFWDSLYNSISWYNQYIDYPIDLNEDGIADDNSWLNEQWSAGIDEFSALAREELGSDVWMVANGHQEKYSTYNGKMVENLRQWEWERDFGRLQDWDEQSKEPKINMVVKQFNEPISGAYKALRWGLGATLLTDAYYEIANNAYVDTWWLDEFAVDLTTGEAITPTPGNSWAGKGYLGGPLDSAYTLDLTDIYHPFDVWRRDFENGIVLVNPNYYSGNPNLASITIDLETEYRKIRGTQDSTVNDGSTITNVTLSYRDAIILLNFQTEGGGNTTQQGEAGRSGEDSGDNLANSEEVTEEQTNKQGLECLTLNEKICINEISYNICENNIWSTPINCGIGRICQEGECLLKKINLREILNNPENRPIFWVILGLIGIVIIITLFVTRRYHRLHV